jgi:hypothetical protein
VLPGALPRENHRKSQNDCHEGQKEKVNAISSILLLPIFGRCGMLAALQTRALSQPHTNHSGWMDDSHISSRDN